MATTTFMGKLHRVGPKYGFISSADAKLVYGDDVFAWGAGEKFSAGDEVEFEVEVNGKGQPQAKNLRFPGQPKENGMSEELFMDPRTGPAQTGGGLPQHTGVVSRAGEKYGFIQSPTVQEQYGVDVFAPAYDLNGLPKGTQVVFELQIDANGRPQAKNVRTKGQAVPAWQGGGTGGGPLQPFTQQQQLFTQQQPSAQPVTLQAAASAVPAQVAGGGNQYQGVVKRAGARFGFIESPEVKQLHGADVFCPAYDLGGFPEGTPVAFDLVIDKDGRPQGKNLRAAGAANDGWSEPKRPAQWGSQGSPPSKRPANSAGFVNFGNVGNGGAPQAQWGTPPLDGATSTGECHIGVISSLKDKYGFILCEETHARYNMDIFCGANDLKGHKVGDTVQFELFLNKKGQPHGKNVTAVAGGSASAQPSSPSG